MDDQSKSRYFMYGFFVLCAGAILYRAHQSGHLLEAVAGSALVYGIIWAIGKVA
jgi:hypothetical protein